MTPRARRIATLEAARRASAKRPIPSVLRVPFGQTIAEARAAFDAEYRPKPGFAVLCVPAKPRTEAEREVWAERFLENQTRLVANARRERVAGIDTAAIEPRTSFPAGIPAAPKGRAFSQWTRNTP